MLTASCNTPSMEFSGIEPSIVNVDQSTFDVRYTENRIETIRTSPEASIAYEQMKERAVMAMQIASGCTVVASTLKGDAAMLTADLDCAY